METSRNFRHTKLSLRVMAFHFVILVFGPIGLAGCEAKLPDEPNPKRVPSSKEVLEDKYKMIQVDMTDVQVDQLLAGHPRAWRELDKIEKRAMAGGYGNRKGTFVITYDEKRGSIEGDFYIEVYYDENHLVLRKYLGEYIR
jgi:hypothetical protein